MNDAAHEVAQQLHAAFAMVHLGMELYTPRLLALDTVGSNWHLLGGRHDAEAFGE